MKGGYKKKTKRKSGSYILQGENTWEAEGETGEV